METRCMDLVQTNEIQAIRFAECEARLAGAERLLRLPSFAALAQAHQQSRGDADPLFGINSATITHGDVRNVAKFLRATASASVSEL
jgi:hypothetical protein